MREHLNEESRGAREAGVQDDRVRILERIKKTEAGCWEWRGARSETGYGRIWMAGKHKRAHRVSYAAFVGPIGDANVLHTCDNPPCVNPQHLYLGTQKDNARDAVTRGRNHNAKKTHCAQGHPYSGENLYVPTNGRRHCRTCLTTATKQWRERKRGSH